MPLKIYRKTNIPLEYELREQYLKRKIAKTCINQTHWIKWNAEKTPFLYTIYTLQRREHFVQNLQCRKKSAEKNVHYMYTMNGNCDFFNVKHFLLHLFQFIYLVFALWIFVGSVFGESAKPVYRFSGNTNECMQMKLR